MENLNTITISREEFEGLLRAKITLELLEKASKGEKYFSKDDMYKICGWKKKESEDKE